MDCLLPGSLPLTWKHADVSSADVLYHKRIQEIDRDAETGWQIISYQKIIKK